MQIILEKKEILVEVGNPTIVISGKAENGWRRAEIYFPIVTGNQKEDYTMVYEGEAFNTFWKNFSNDKWLYEEFARHKGIELSLVDVPDDLLNPELPKEEVVLELVDDVLEQPVVEEVKAEEPITEAPVIEEPKTGFLQSIKNLLLKEF